MFGDKYVVIGTMINTERLDFLHDGPMYRLTLRTAQGNKEVVFFEEVPHSSRSPQHGPKVTFSAWQTGLLHPEVHQTLEGYSREELRADLSESTAAELLERYW